MYTRSFGLSVSNGVTVTTTTRTITETAYETGCPLDQYTTTAGCGGNARRHIETFPASETATATATATAVSSAIASNDIPALVARDPDWSPDWADDMKGCSQRVEAAFYLDVFASESDVNQVMARLFYTKLPHHRFEHPNLGRAVLIWVYRIPYSLAQKILHMPGVGHWLFIYHLLTPFSANLACFSLARSVTLTCGTSRATMVFRYPETSNHGLCQLRLATKLSSKEETLRIQSLTAQTTGTGLKSRAIRTRSGTLKELLTSRTTPTLATSTVTTMMECSAQANTFTTRNKGWTWAML